MTRTCEAAGCTNAARTITPAGILCSGCAASLAADLRDDGDDVAPDGGDVDPHDGESPRDYQAALADRARDAGDEVY